MGIISQAMKSAIFRGIPCLHWESECKKKINQNVEEEKLACREQDPSQVAGTPSVTAEANETIPRSSSQSNRSNSRPQIPRGAMFGRKEYLLYFVR